MPIHHVASFELKPRLSRGSDDEIVALDDEANLPVFGVAVERDPPGHESGLRASSRRCTSDWQGQDAILTRSELRLCGHDGGAAHQPERGVSGRACTARS